MLLKSILLFSNSWQRLTPQIVPRSGSECKGSPGQPADWLSPQLCTYRQHKTVIDSLSSLWSRSERERAVIPRLPPRPCFQSINSSRGFPHFWVEFPQKRRKCLSEYHVRFPLFISFFLFLILVCSPKFLLFFPHSTAMHCLQCIQNIHSASPFPHFVILQPYSEIDKVSFSQNSTNHVIHYDDNVKLLEDFFFNMYSNWVNGKWEITHFMFTAFAKYFVFVSRRLFK